ncbi:MAG: SH3 domain-containing protein [Clostridiales bacterium]|nr:SH3 domain-containing protein [Clostridiales bacterium]
MSKTVATCIAETNLIQGEPQENVFFLTLSRKIEDFPNEFLRTARSTSPIQICAIFSTIGPDNLSAVLNLELNAELERIASACANQAVLDFDGFANQVINNLNVKVCNFAANKGTQFKTSMSMFVIEGDILRVIHVGITKAVLFRNNRIMLLTEEQTVAHRYVQMGAIQPSEELTHPENMNLTQYLGKMPQEGPVNADKKVHLKLQDNDELFLMGVGLSRRLPSQMRNSIIAKPQTTEVKAKEIINAAVSYGIKSGLTLIDMKVESTFLLPGDAVINSNLRTEAGLSRKDNQKAAESNAFTDFENDKELDYDSDSSDTINYVPGSAVASYAESDEEELIVNESKERVKTIIIPLIIFIVCIILGFGVTFMIFNMKDLINFGDSTTTTLPVGVGSVLYANENMVPVYSKASEEATVIGTLNLGDPVTLKEITNEAFSKILTANNVTGYVASDKLTAENPITGTSEFDPFGDATSVTTGEVTLPDGETIQTTGVKKDNIYYPPTATPKPTLESIGTDEFGNPIYPTPTPDPNKPTPTPDPNKPTPTTAPATPTPKTDNPSPTPKTDDPTPTPKTDDPTPTPKPADPTTPPKPTETQPKPTDPPPPENNTNTDNNG